MIPGKQINLWAIEKGDLLQNYIWANDPEIRAMAGMTPFPRSAWDVDRWYETLQGNPNVKAFAIKTTEGAYIGNVEIGDIEWRSRTGEIGIIIGDRKSRGRGLGKEAVIMAARFAFEEMGLHRLYAKVLSFNQGACNLFKSIGFIKEGVEREAFYIWGGYRDVVIYGMLIGEFLEKYPYKPLEDLEESPAVQ